MGKKVVLSADSTCDLTPELFEKYNISRLPLYITFGEESFRDGIEITPDELYQKVKETGVLPKTSAVSVGDFIEYFEKLLEDADQIIHFSLSSGLSCTYQNAVLAAADFNGRVFLVDTLNLSTGEALTILHAAELLAAGHTAEEIVADCESYVKRVDASFIVDNLEFLRKGGRCSALAALGANLLSIKPCIEVGGGKMDVGKKYRGKFKAVLQKYIEERLASDDIDTSRIFVTHAGCADDVVEAAYQAVLDTGLFSEVLQTRAGCTISSHCGPDTLGILFVRNREI
ncbi:MAG: DegV family protein [Clostridia bacterium]|nr:DegV family protein [Clostridia bacterium]